MKKFFQSGGVGGGGGVESTPPPRTSITSNGYSTAMPNLHLVSSAGYLATPVVASGGGAAASPSPRTPLPQYTTSSQQQYFDIQKTTSLSPSPSTTMLGSGVLASVQNISVTPGAISNISDSNNSITNMQGHTVERNDMHKGLKSLETLLVTLDEYRDLKSKLAKSEKRLAKNLCELGKCKMLEDIPSQTLQSSALLFDSITDTSSKHAKLIQKEYETLNEHCGKYFKKVAKEERVHDELLDTLDSKVKRAHASHEKNSKKSGRMAIETHDRYIQTVQSLTQEITRAKATHNASVGNKTFITSLFVASTLGGIADCEFKALCESVRRSGSHIGKLNEWLNFASTEGMANVQPMDLNEDAMGWAQVLAIKEAEIREEMVKQEQAKYAHLEHAQALLKAQQMGWTPPNLQKRTSDETRLRAASTASFSNMPQLDSKGQLIDHPSVSRTVSMAESQKYSPVVSKTANIQESKLMEESIAEEGKETHSQQSSLADGTVIDRGDIVTIEDPIKLSSPMKTSTSRDSSDAMSTSMNKDSDESVNTTTRSVSRSTGPPTPNDEMPPRDILIIKGVPERVEGILKKHEIIEEVEIKVERPADRYVDVQINKQNMSGIKAVIQKSDIDEDRTRRLSLWEHEKERERQVDREAELHRRLMEAEDRLRTMDKGGNLNRREEFRPRHSEPIRNPQQPTRQDEEIPARRYEPERYAPSVGMSRLSSGGVNRTLSTDSERSFVAKMKARYQEDKVNSSPPSPRPAPPTFVKSGGKGYTTASLPSSASRNRFDSAPTRIVEDQKILHAADCGCWSCSSRHYSSPLTTNKNTSQPLYQRQNSPPPVPHLPRQFAALQHQPPNQRRQTMPPLRDDRSTAALSSPQQSREVYPSRSFEVEADRRTVMFANDYQTIR